MHTPHERQALRDVEELIALWEKALAENAKLRAYARVVTAMCRQTLTEDIGDAWHTYTDDDLDALIAEHGVQELLHAEKSP